MELFMPLFCAVATFVLISDQVRTVAAEGTTIQRVKRQDKYTTEYDTLDIDRIIRSERLIRAYIRCLLDKGPCTREGRALKKYLPDALQTDCSKCSETQKRWGGKVLSHVLQYYRPEWNDLVEKYDPTGIFRKKYGFDAEEEEAEEESNEDGDDEARRK